MNELLNDIPYGIIVCNRDGSISYLNESAKQLINNDKSEIDNILSLIDDVDKMRHLLENAINSDIKDSSNFNYLKIKDSEKFYKFVAKVSNFNSNNIVMMVYDYTKTKQEIDDKQKSYDTINDNLIRNTLVLKAISHICDNVLCKNRSDLSEIILELSHAFHLKKSAICFRNGTRHIVYTRKKSDDTYECGKIDGEPNNKNCLIWENEINFINSKDLIFKVSPNITCCDADGDHTPNDIIILKLKLDTQKVIGFFEFVEDSYFKLSEAELEILESLSQLLAYIVDDKERIIETTNYIRSKFKALTTV